MYVLLFTALLGALVGAYTHIYTKQNVRVVEMQSGLSDTMVVWHSTAVALAQSLLKKSDFSTAPCSLTFQSSKTYPEITGVSLCQYNNAVLGIGGAYVGMEPTLGTQCTGLSYGLSPPESLPPTVSPPCWVGLPIGYNKDGAYFFNSIAFLAPNGTPYLLTYIPPPAASSDVYGIGFLCLPGGIAGNCPAGHRRFPYSFQEFYRQMTTSSLLSPLSYGVVSAAAKLVTPQVEGFFGASTSMSAVYDVPNSSIVPAGSIGIITELVPYSE